MDHRNMIKSLFIGVEIKKQVVSVLKESGANHLIVAQAPLDQKQWRRLQNLDVTLAISVNVFDQGGCPASPRALKILFKRVLKALSFNPKQIWLDHFRFDGHWEVGGGGIGGIHRDCQWCGDKNRVKILTGLAEKAIDLVGRRAEVGYFAVPFKSDEVKELVFDLGQDHGALGRIFDWSSPMLYHRMIEKPVSYISEYVKWLSQKTRKPVLPIIQIKEMPDNLPDRLSRDEIREAFKQACKPPSEGVSFFSWDHALEKDKVELVKELFGFKH